jgi:hypothetical protein
MVSLRAHAHGEPPLTRREYFRSITPHARTSFIDFSWPFRVNRVHAVCICKTSAVVMSHVRVNRLIWSRPPRGLECPGDDSGTANPCAIPSMGYMRYLQLLTSCEVCVRPFE